MMRHPSAARAAFILWAFGVAWLSLTDDPEAVDASFNLTKWIAASLFGDETLGDKVGHFLSYAALGALAVAARLRLLSGWLAIVAALAAYGALLEVVQGMGGVRTPDFFDGLADAAGAALGSGLAMLFSPRATAPA